MRLYQRLNVPALQLFPYDYFGDLLAENAYGKRQGFFPTPHTVVEAMTQMTFVSDLSEGKEEQETDIRLKSVCDPCVGTGRMLLHASNRSLRLYGMDIDETLCKATRVNGYLFAPWLALPFWWLEGKTPLGVVQGDALRDHLDLSETSTVSAQSEPLPDATRKSPSKSPLPLSPDLEGEDVEDWRFEEDQGRLF